MSALPLKADIRTDEGCLLCAAFQDQAYISSDSSHFVERQLREERQGVLDGQPLLRCERLEFRLIARAQHRSD